VLEPPPISRFPNAQKDRSSFEREEESPTHFISSFRLPSTNSNNIMNVQVANSPQEMLLFHRLLEQVPKGTLCREEVQEEVDFYYFVVAGVFALTMVMIMTYSFCLKPHLDGAAGLHAQFFFVSGIVKIALGAMFLVAIQPHCPEDCNGCPGARLPQPVYPVVCFVVGAYWLYQGFEKFKKARMLADGVSNADDRIYQPASIVEL